MGNLYTHFVYIPSLKVQRRKILWQLKIESEKKPINTRRIKVLKKELHEIKIPPKYVKSKANIFSKEQVDEYQKRIAKLFDKSNLTKKT